MENEPLLPLGEPTLYFNPPAKGGRKPDLTIQSTPALPSPKRQSWGALLSIIVIMLMIILGAFYTWGKRIAEQNQIPAGLAP